MRLLARLALLTYRQRLPSTSLYGRWLRALRTQLWQCKPHRRGSTAIEPARVVPEANQSKTLSSRPRPGRQHFVPAVGSRSRPCLASMALSHEMLTTLAKSVQTRWQIQTKCCNSLPDSVTWRAPPAPLDVPPLQFAATCFVLRVEAQDSALPPFAFVP